MYIAATIYYYKCNAKLCIIIYLGGLMLNAYLLLQLNISGCNCVLYSTKLMTVEKSNESSMSDKQNFDKLIVTFIGKLLQGKDWKGKL